MDLNEKVRELNSSVKLIAAVRILSRLRLIKYKENNNDNAIKPKTLKLIAACELIYGSNKKHR